MPGCEKVVEASSNFNSMRHERYDPAKQQTLHRNELTARFQVW